MPLGHESVPGTLCIQNVLATAHQTAGATLAGAPPTARLSKCTISSVTRAWSGMTTLKPQQRSTRTCLNTHRRIMGSLCTQKMLATAPQIACATLGRATPLAHPNAPSRALYGPGVARPQPQKRSTCVVPTRLKLGSGVGWRCAYWHFRGAGREPREFFFGATTLWNPFFVTMLMCHV